MAHEIQYNDKVVLNRIAAWHGLGVVVDKDLTPREAVRMVFPWEVEQLPMRIQHNGQQQIVENYVLNIRSDDGTQLGVVSESYKTIQPMDLADFAEALIEQGQVKIETAGSIRGGRKLWLLLKGEEFNVANGDLMYPYFLLSNGYDGLTRFRGTPTTVRAVCSNTLHAVIPHFDTGELGSAAFAFSHTQNIMERIEEAKRALAGYGKALEETKKFIDTLAKKEVTREQIEKFFFESYTLDFGEVPMNPQNGSEARRKERAYSALNSFSRRFDDEKQTSGTSAWCMLNAYSGMVQHDQKARGRDDVNRIERRVESNLFGLNQERTYAAAERAFRVALAG